MKIGRLRSSHTRHLKLVLKGLSCRTHGVVESVLDLFGPASVYSGWVRLQVRFAAFLSE